MMPDGVAAAPDAVLEMIKCNCASESPCAKQTCTCFSAKLSCNKFCKCYDNNCCNTYTEKDNDGLSDEYENEEEENGEE